MVYLESLNLLEDQNWYQPVNVIGMTSISYNTYHRTGSLNSQSGTSETSVLYIHFFPRLFIDGGILWRYLIRRKGPVTLRTEINVSDEVRKSNRVTSLCFLLYLTFLKVLQFFLFLFSESRYLPVSLLRSDVVELHKNR